MSTVSGTQISWDAAHAGYALPQRRDRRPQVGKVATVADMPDGGTVVFADDYANQPYEITVFYTKD